MSDAFEYPGGSVGDRRSDATLRLQLHRGYTLHHALDDLPYFERLGVSHLYLSPVSRSREGSTHGYDVVDHQSVDPDRGGESALRALSEEARLRGMGILLDIVPNHMATDPGNAWWWDVLQHGPDSAYAGWFDIDWQAEGMDDKVLAPFLGKPYEDALAGGDIRLQDAPGSGRVLMVHDVPYPLAPGAPSGDLRDYDPGTPEGRERLHALLERQHYRLAEWRSAAQRINWRRFFEVSELIGVRVEVDEVFQAVHALPLRLYAEGVIDGLRIDHVDGLARPLEYCRKLSTEMRRCEARRPRPLPLPSPWVVVEKILAPEEILDSRWEVSGTTGYDFAADVGGLLHDPDGELPLTLAWTDIARDDRPPEAWLTEARQEMLDRHFMAERAALLRTLETRQETTAPPSGVGLHTSGTGADSGPSSATLGQALDALLRYFPVYRTYVEDEARAPADQPWFEQALSGAAAATADQPSVRGWLPILDAWLGGQAVSSAQAREGVRRFQQLTPPLAAKSLEDTVFYRYGRLLSRNEVGSDPAEFSVSVNDFHRRCERRATDAPYGLLATATHDHKRGEDVRARLAVLSEVPDDWTRSVRTWLNRPDLGLTVAGRAPGPFLYMLLQTLVGAWPPGLDPDDAPAVTSYLERVEAWMIKALREGKQYSSWFEPDTRTEDAFRAFLGSLVPGGAHHDLMHEMAHWALRLEPGAIANGLIQTALRMTCPGMPDLYQGTEFRDFSLVDPDNRRPVDFARRAETLQAFLGESAGETAGAPGPVLHPDRWAPDAWSEGWVKQGLIAMLLQLRQQRQQAFRGAYARLDVEGDASHKLLAFSREDDVVVVAGLRCMAGLRAGPGGMPVHAPDYWAGASVSLPGTAGRWRDILRDRVLHGPVQGVRGIDLLPDFPLAILCREP